MMGYINMDHAGWLERNIAASKRLPATKAELRAAKDGMGWHAAPDSLTPFQQRAFNILGIVGGGIYNAPIAWNTVVWEPRFVCLKWRSSMSTFDFMNLTRFVFLCHEARIRGDISSSMRYLEIHMHERGAAGGMGRRHPNLDEAVAAFRAEMPIDHSTFYREPAEDAA